MEIIPQLLYLVCKLCSTDFLGRGELHEMMTCIYGDKQTAGDTQRVKQRLWG